MRSGMRAFFALVNRKQKPHPAAIKTAMALSPAPGAWLAAPGLAPASEILNRIGIQPNIHLQRQLSKP
jgi:hypothetical protein